MKLTNQYGLSVGNIKTIKIIKRDEQICLMTYNIQNKRNNTIIVFEEKKS